MFCTVFLVGEEVERDEGRKRILPDNQPLQRH